MEEHIKPYPDPSPRTFDEWLESLGLNCEGPRPSYENPLTYEDFVFLPGNHRYVKAKSGSLYGFWRKYGDIYGEPRTVQEWLTDLNWELVDPTEDDIRDYDLFLGYDEFWQWSSGKVDPGGR
jgi:hypothetical protein